MPQQQSTFCQSIWPFIKCLLISMLLFWSLGLYLYIKSLPNAQKIDEDEREKTHERFDRLKRDFMFAPGRNETSDSDCFQVFFEKFWKKIERFLGKI